MLCLTLYVHAAARSAQSASLAPLGHTSQVVVSSGRSSSTAQVRLPLSDALSGSSALSVHCGVMLGLGLGLANPNPTPTPNPNPNPNLRRDAQLGARPGPLGGDWEAAAEDLLGAVDVGEGGHRRARVARRVAAPAVRRRRAQRHPLRAAGRAHARDAVEEREVLLPG